ncbi:MAG TPA: AraC family transcriptional regulator [Blastocatellia bacterium]|jgi:AraC-like DNA-binding protein|nr:AraC family transcriptional regulator [Blastocatellia bacterium]
MRMSGALANALADRALNGRPGDAIVHPISSGHGWLVKDVICDAGPDDSPFEEKNDYVSIAIVVAGSFKYRSARGSAVLSPGSLLLGSADESFECGHEHGSGDRCVSFNYATAFFERLAADSAVKGASLNFPVHRLPELPSLVPLTAEAQLGLHRPRSVNFEELALELAGRVLTALGASPVLVKGPTIRDERRIATALRFIELHFRQPMSLEELSALVGISPYHFLRTFKQVVGLTPHQFLIRRRLREAALRLRTTTESVLDIALDAGFGDLSNFNHTFRAAFGTTPTNYRASSRLSWTSAS